VHEPGHHREIPVPSGAAQLLLLLPGTWHRAGARRELRHEQQPRRAHLAPPGGRGGARGRGAAGQLLAHQASALRLRRTSAGAVTDIAPAAAARSTGGYAGAGSRLLPTHHVEVRWRWVGNETPRQVHWTAS